MILLQNHCTLQSKSMAAVSKVVTSSEAALLCARQAWHSLCFPCAVVLRLSVVVPLFFQHPSPFPWLIVVRQPRQHEKGGV